jgi:hypothetical protein
MLIHPSREERSDCSKPKGEYLHSSYLHTKFSQSDDNSRVPTCLRVQYTFSASVPVLTTTSVQVSQDNCNHSSSKIIPDLPVTLHNCPNSGQRKTWKQTHNKVSCFVSSSVQNSFHFLHSSGRFYWLTVLHAQLKQFPQLQLKPRMLPDASEKSRSTFPNRWCPHVSFSLTPSPTNSLNTKFHCAFSAMTVPISLSLSTPVPILPGKPQCFRLQFQGYQSVQTSVKPHCSCTLPPEVR